MNVDSHVKICHTLLTGWPISQNSQSENHQYVSGFQICEDSYVKSSHTSSQIS